MFGVLWLIALPNDGGLRTTVLEVAVNTVIGSIEFCTRKPARISLCEVAAENLLPRFMPVQELSCLICPKLFGTLYGLSIEGLVAVLIEMAASNLIVSDGIGFCG